MCVCVHLYIIVHVPRQQRKKRSYPRPHSLHWVYNVQYRRSGRGACVGVVYSRVQYFLLHMYFTTTTTVKVSLAVSSSGATRASSFHAYNSCMYYSVRVSARADYLGTCTDIARRLHVGRGLLVGLYLEVISLDAVCD